MFRVELTTWKGQFRVLSEQFGFCLVYEGMHQTLKDPERFCIGACPAANSRQFVLIQNPLVGVGRSKHFGEVLRKVTQDVAVKYLRPLRKVLEVWWR